MKECFAAEYRSHSLLSRKNHQRSRSIPYMCWNLSQSCSAETNSKPEVLSFHLKFPIELNSWLRMVALAIAIVYSSSFFVTLDVPEHRWIAACYFPI